MKEISKKKIRETSKPKSNITNKNDAKQGNLFYKMLIFCNVKGILFIFLYNFYVYTLIRNT